MAKEKYKYLKSVAAVAKLADALRSGRSGSNPLEVQVLSAAHLIFPFLNLEIYPMQDKQEKILRIARSFLGREYDYSHSSETLENFLDCSSFTREVFKNIGIELPRTSLAQATASKKIEEHGLDIGDLIFFRGKKGHYNDEWFPERNIYIGHVAIFIGGGKVIHASRKNGNVAEESLSDVLVYEGPIVVIKRIL